LVAPIIPVTAEFSMWTGLRLGEAFPYNQMILTFAENPDQTNVSLWIH
jgi:hypothetical protein